MNQKYFLLRGAFILTAAGFLSRIMGFFYRIFLSRSIGAEGLGLYQLIFPVFGFAMAFSVSGIQTAISHYVSGKSALKDTRAMREYFISGLLLSLFLSVIIAILIWKHAEFLAFSYLNDARCTELLRYLSVSIPFSALHSCILGYFMGLKRTKIPAVSQLFEQSVRILSSYVFYRILTRQDLAVTPLVAVVGSLCSEIASSLFTLTLLVLEFSRTSSALPFPALKSIKKISLTAAPLSGNRLLISFLQSMEALLIPSRLRLFGYTSSQALSQYGVLSGMALPLVLFPSAITGSISMLLLPTVSESQSLHNRHAISRTIEATISGSLLLGIFCTGLFLLFGPELGMLIYDTSAVGDYILILAWSCPFMYLGTTLSSILNGLGKTMTTFLHNAAGLCIRIIVVWFCIPRFGLTAYLVGLLASQLTTAFLAIAALRREAAFSFSPWKNLILPLAALLLSFAMAECGNCLTSLFHVSSSYLSLTFRGLLFAGTYLFFIIYMFRE